MSNFERFKPPSKGDEISYCAQCQRKMHYTALDENGLCEDCAPDDEDVEDEIE